MKVNFDSVKIFKKAVDQARKQMINEVQKAIRDCTLKVYSQAMRETPVRTGRLQKHRFTITKLKGRIYPTVKYARFVHEGTGLYGPRKAPYIIRPKKARALRFKIGGRIIYRKQVTHPGIKPNAFYTRAILKTSDYVRDRLRQGGANLIVTLKK